jgi:hypothetical protein
MFSLNWINLDLKTHIVQREDKEGLDTVKRNVVFSIAPSLEMEKRRVQTKKD